MFRYVTLTVLLVVVVVSGRPQGPPQQQPQPQHGGQPQQPPVAIISQSEQYNPDGSYSFAYEADNSIKVQNEGQVKQVTVPRSEGDGLGPNDPPQQGTVVVQKGSYSYTAPDGQVISITYTADENGFQAQGDAIPTQGPSAAGGAPQQPGHPGQQQTGAQQYNQQQFNQQQQQQPQQYNQQQIG